ncbi:O-antigen ligase family protein [Ferruginibacter sp.]
MRKLLFIEETTANRISYYLLLCFLIALPFDFFYSELLLICFGLHTIIHVESPSWKNIFSTRVLTLVAVFIVGLLGILYSSGRSEGFNVSGRQSAILIIPVLFAISNINLENYRLNLVCIFGFTCTITVLYLFASALSEIRSLHLSYSSLFTARFMNHRFSLPIKLHATYLSMYVTFSLLAFLYLLFTNKELRYKWIYIFCCIVLAVGMLQLSSRAVFISFLVIINLLFPFFVFKGKKRWLFLTCSLFISAATLFAIEKTDSFKERYISNLKTDLSLSGEQQLVEDAEPRFARWEAIMQLVKASPVIGYGSGSEKELLSKLFFDKKMFVAYLNEFNAHNEYLSFLIKTGIVGLALFLFVLYSGFKTAFQNKDILFLVFLGIISMVSLSENILDVNKGVFFYSFFFSLFFINNKAKLKSDT